MIGRAVAEYAQLRAYAWTGKESAYKVGKEGTGERKFTGFFQKLERTSRGGGLDGRREGTIRMSRH